MLSLKDDAVPECAAVRGCPVESRVGRLDEAGRRKRVIVSGEFVECLNGNSVTKLRASDGRNLGTFPTGPGPYAIAFDGANIWVTNIPDGTVSKR